MTSLRKKEREYSVLRLVAGSMGDETLMASSRASPLPQGNTLPCGSELARDSGFGFYVDNN